MPDTDKAKLEEFRTRNGKHPKYQVSFNGFILHTFDSKNSAEIYVNGFNQMHHQSLEAAKREAYEAGYDDRSLEADHEIEEARIDEVNRMPATSRAESLGYKKDRLAQLKSPGKPSREKGQLEGE